MFSFELYFYLVVGLILSSRWLKPIPVFLVISLAIVVKNVFTTPGHNQWLDFFFSHYVYEFIFGYLIFYYWQHIAAKKWLFASLAFGIVFLTIGAQLDLSNGYAGFIAFGLFSVCLVWLMLLLEAHNLIIFRGLIKKVGDSSYTLYLLHTILLGLFYSLGIRDYLVLKNFALSGFIAYIVLIVLLSWLFYIFIEAPLYQYAKQRLRQKSG